MAVSRGDSMLGSGIEHDLATSLGGGGTAKANSFHELTRLLKLY